MSKKAELVLDSYRLAQYSVQVPCYICDEGNSFDAEFCRHCFAPMSLAHQAECQKVQPLMIACLGASGVGKTVYLGMLMDMLSRRTGDTQLLARGAFSINLQQTTMASLSQCEFPDKTPTEPDCWNWVHCQAKTKQFKKPVELMIPDMAGEAIMEEIDHPHSFKVIRSLLTKCSGAMILVDANESDAGENDQDYFTMKLLSYLSELDRNPKTGWNNRPVSVVFTKADRVESCFIDPKKYAQEHTQGLDRHCQERFPKHQFFAAGVSGPCAFREEFGGGRVHIPLRIEPRGITEPFEWLLNNIKLKK